MSETNPLAYPSDEHNYNVAWKFMPENWSSDFSDYSGRCNLPIFIGADDWVEYNETGSFRGNPLSICIGILYSWFEPDKWLFISDIDVDEYRKKALTYYGMFTNAEDLENLIISSAAWVRWNCGCNPSQRVLGGGVCVLPESAGVRFDYLLDSWSVLERFPNVDVIEMAKSIVSVGHGIDLGKLAASSEQGPKQVNSVYYTMLASLLLGGQKDLFLDLLKQWIESGAHAPDMMNTLMSAANKDSVTVDDLRIFTGNAVTGQKQTKH
jgi:hypothetical protein